MFTMCNAVLNACWDTTTAWHHWTEQWRHDQVGLCLLPNGTDFIIFLTEIQLTTNLVSIHIFFQQLTCSVMFFLLKSVCEMSVFVCKRHFWWRHIWRYLHVTILKCWDKFCNVLKRWGIKMIRAKKYKTVIKVVKVMPRILWPLFSRTRCICTQSFL